MHIGDVSSLPLQSRAIQYCLARNGSNEQYCQGTIEAWKKCCATAEAAAAAAAKAAAAAEKGAA